MHRKLPILSGSPWLVLLSLTALQSCWHKAAHFNNEYDVGEKVRVGSFTYNVIESKWKSQMGEFPAPRVPERNFLLIRLSLTNGSGSERTAPPLVLENSAGEVYKELTDGRGVEQWLGLLRKVAPAQTDEGWILFDVPTNTYRMKISETDESTGVENVAYVRIPLQLETQ